MTADQVAIEAERLRRVISRRIADLVAAKRTDRAKLAAALGTSETRVSRIMKESSDLSAVELVLAARHMQVPVAVLTGEAGADAIPRRK